MPRLQPYKDAAGEYRWRAIADNGNTIADSGEGYKNVKDMLDVIDGLFPDRDLDRTPIDWSMLPSSANPDALIDDGDDNDGNDD